MQQGDCKESLIQNDHRSQKNILRREGKKSKPKSDGSHVQHEDPGRVCVCRCGRGCCCEDYDDDVVAETPSGTTIQEPTQNPWVRYPKIAAFFMLWLTFTAFLIAKGEKPTTIQQIAIPEGEIRNYWVKERSNTIKLYLEVTGPFLPEEYKNLSDKSLFIWIQLVQLRAGFDPVTNATTFKPGYVRFTKNITGVWEIPIVTRELLDVVPDVTGKKIFEFEDVEGWMVEESHLRIQMTTNLEASFPVAVKINAEPINTNLGIVLAALVLVGLYIVISIEIVPRTLAAICGSTMSVAILAAMNERPTMKELISWIDMETLLLLFSMMMIVGVLSETGIFEYITAVVYQLAKDRPIRLAVMIILISGIMSSVLDNLTTILLLTPCIIRLCNKESINPVPVLMSTVIISNITGIITPVGDPPNVIIANNKYFIAGGVDFGTFTQHMGLGAIFALTATCVFLYFKFNDLSSLKYTECSEILHLKSHLDIWERLAASLSSYSSDEDAVRVLLVKKIKHLRKDLKVKRMSSSGLMTSDISDNSKEEWPSSGMISRELLIKTTVVLTFVIVMFSLHSRAHLNLSLGWIALLGAILLLILADDEPIDGVLARVEWGTLLFFASLFILMEATARLGLIRWIGNQTEYVILMVNEEARLAVAILLILWVSALASAFVDNIPLTTMMVRIVENLNAELGLPLQPLVWSLAFGACLGGNGTLIGASANVVCAGVAEQHGYRFTFLEFFRVGFPVMMITVMVTSVYLLVCHVWIEWN